MYLTLIKSFLTAKAVWIKIAVAIILAVSVLAYVYSAGKDSERAEWLEQEQSFLAKQHAIKEENDKRIKENQEKYDQILLGVINDRNEQISERDNRINQLVANGLRISSKNCTGSNGVSTKAKDTGQLDSSTGSGEIQLSESTTRSLAQVTEDAMDLVDRYNNLREICLPLVEVVE